MNIEPLLYWCREREAIRKRKEAFVLQPDAIYLPWSEDPIFNTYRFCNVRRSDDRVSQWLIKHVLIEDYIRIDLPGFLLFSALCRWINWPPTIKDLLDVNIRPGGQLDWSQIGALIDERCAAGEKTWTGAYMVRAKPGDNNRGKGRYVAEEVIEQSLNIEQIIQALNTNHRQAVWDTLENSPNWGSFMAGQVVADWGYTSLLKNAVDTYTWAPQGPGSKRGFNRIMDRPLNQKISDEEWVQNLRQWRDAIILTLGSAEYGSITLHDVQNCLCELDKYLRVKEGQGRPRAKYRPETAF